MQITIQAFDNLRDAKPIIEIRTAVFMLEQGFTEEFDAIDKVAQHLLLSVNARPAACCRIFPDQDEAGSWILGRIAVIRELRGLGLGEAMLGAALSFIGKKTGAKKVKLAAQLQAQGFYEKFGFKPVGEVFYEETCPHQWMELRVQA